MISLKNIGKVYGSGSGAIWALRSINLNIERGEFIGLMGPSGSGKSTLLNIIGLIETPDEGTYIFNEQQTDGALSKRSRLLRADTFGYVTQSFGLINELTVEENIRLPRKFSSKTRKGLSEKSEQLIKRLNIYDKRKDYPSHLSGGQCQRAAIARALINDPHVLLADEPTGALDTKNSFEVLNIFKELNSQGITVIMATHNEKFAPYFTRTIMLKDGELE